MHIAPVPRLPSSLPMRPCRLRGSGGHAAPHLARPTYRRGPAPTALLSGPRSRWHASPCRSHLDLPLSSLATTRGPDVPAVVDQVIVHFRRAVSISRPHLKRSAERSHLHHGPRRSSSDLVNPIIPMCAIGGDGLIEQRGQAAKAAGSTEHANSAFALAVGMLQLDSLLLLFRHPQDAYFKNVVRSSSLDIC